MDHTVKPCPFCGHDAEVKRTSTYGQVEFRVWCPTCHCGTLPIAATTYAMYHGEEKKVFTAESAAREAIDIWNRRVRSSRTALQRVEMLVHTT